MDAPLLSLATSFSAIAALYDAVRPGYPPDVIDRALAQSPTPTPRILEIGCGSGQATVPFAAHGHPLIATDPSRELIALGRRRLAHFSNVTFLEGAFEELTLPDASADLLISAQAFHWVDLERGLPQMRRLLSPGGGVALFWNVIDYDADPFLAHLRDCCVAHAPAFAGWPDASREAFNRFQEHWQQTFTEAPGFEAPAVAVFPTTLPLSHEHLLQLIESFSWAQALGAAKAALVADLSTMVAGAPAPLLLPLRTLLVTTRTLSV